MRTRRETLGTSGGAAQPPTVVAPPQQSLAGETVLPTQQQRAMGQLKTAMLNLNKRHGSSTTNEILNQIIQALSFTDEDRLGAAANYKPEYTDVVCDTEISNPPLPQETPAVGSEKKSIKTIKAVPKWFSFDEVSSVEKSYFGPLFSMDEERWKIYLSLRNDVVRIYEDLVAHCSSEKEKANVYLSSSDLRQRLHPKDDAAYIFEMWRLLTEIGVINRGRVEEIALKTASGDGIISRSDVKPVPPTVPSGLGIAATTYTRINCTACGRECKFFCYKPLPPPPETPEAVVAPLTAVEEELNPMESSEEKSVKQETGDEASVSSYMCHDCTPAFFEKIPLRLFIDQDTKDRILRGEFEEVGKDDLKSFLIIPSCHKTPILNIDEKSDKASLVVLKKIANTSGVVPSWDQYLATESGTSAAVNPLEILDPLMQEALSGAGQKIRGSVLIEQQVRNTVYGASLHNDEVEPVCPTTIERAHALIDEIFRRVAQRLDQPLPSGVVNSAAFVLAKKTHATHFELLSLVWRVSSIAKELKQEILTRLDGTRLHALAAERLSVKKQFADHLRQMDVDSGMEVSPDHVGPEIFKTVKVDSSVKLASTNPAQLRLVAL